MRSIERRIKVVLAAKKMSIEVLGQKAGITKATIHNIFNKNDSKLSHLQKIAQILEVPVTYLLGSSEGPDGPQSYPVISQENPEQMQENSELYQTRQERRIAELEAALERATTQTKSLEKELQLKDQLLKAQEELIVQLRGIK